MHFLKSKDSAIPESLGNIASAEEIFGVNNRYDKELARRYFEKHKRGLWRRLSNWREQHVAARALALAGEPKSVLDLPCGAGRFWELLARVPDRKLMAADYSQDMINTALNFQPPHIAKRFEVFQTSAFDIKLPDASVDCIFCMRLLHHIDGKEARAKIFREFHRVSSDTVCLSLWVGGNLQALRRRRYKDRHHTQQHYTRFLVDHNQIESELRQRGFDIMGYVDLLPVLSMWRTYVLKRR